MASDSKPLSGPDLEKGVSWQELREGQPLAGQASGEAVILVRQGEEAFVVGATCTHYGGPLAEGLVVGDTVRCPWHHARFSLRSGQAVGGPALNPLPCFQVERRDGLVRVTGKRPDLAPPAPPASPSAVVIVGAGPAGAACAETLRKEGFKGPVTLIGDEPPGPVDRPNLSKDYLAGTAPEEWIPLRGPEFYAEIGVTFVLGDAAVRLDPAAHTVALASGRTLSYGALVLATGAEPRKLNVPGSEGARVFLLRTLDQSRAIVAAATTKARRAVLVGASFIGLEVAASLRKRGLEVDVVGPEPVPLARVLGDEVGAFVRKVHEQNGVRFTSGTGVAKILPDAVELQNGGRLPADLVVAGVGVIPRTDLGQAAGLAVDNGYVVDDGLRTSVPDIYAAGDVARFPDPRLGTHIRIEHFVVAERQGQAAARSILGRPGGYREVPFFWSQHHDVTLSYVGHAPGWDRIETRGSLEARDYAAFYLRGERVLAVLTVGRDQLLLQAEAALEAGDDAALKALLS